MNKNVGAVRTAIRNGSKNQLTATSNQEDFPFDNAIAEEIIQLKVLTLISQRSRAVKKLCLCTYCGKSSGSEKMSDYKKVCKKCLETVRTKSDKEKRRFIDSMLNNFHKFLREATAR
jgi:tRNA(Ile2) C34 agmatinyltransferase TiaS